VYGPGGGSGSLRAGHRTRLEALRGKIDDRRFHVIASRFATTEKKEEAEVKVEEPTLGAAALQDLMLQAEILVQYGMRAKAVERLQRIHELFPREEERNPELQKLYIAAGIEHKYAKPAPPRRRLRRPRLRSPSR